MSLAPGTRLGPYEVGDALGAGGMGEVYRATDTNLKREVAIKVLPSSVSADPDRLARFQREAEVLATLNHPNIAQIYGLERSGGTTALVMELVEGPTLADRIARGPVPVEEVLAIAGQIALALENAHEQGIIHRDLKPANVKVRTDGTVKVLDFGLAKAMDTGVGSQVGDPSQSPTMTSPAMTAMGLILGTAAYMSPEQARGKAVDRRTDVWAFGCVLYEMLTGRPAFDDEDVSLTLSKVLQRDPDFELFPANVPGHVRRIVRLCLQKRLSERVTDVGTVRLALEGAFVTAPERPTEPLPASKSPRKRLTVVLALGLATIVGMALGRYALAPGAPAPRTFAFDVTVPEGVIEMGSFALSPDGTRLALVLRDASGERQLAVRDMDLVETRVLPGTQGALYPFWSPDGREIGYFAGQQLSRIALDGAAARPIATVPDPRGGAWAAGDVILVGSGSGPIQRVSASGGRLEPVTEVESGVEDTHAWPALLPDRRRFVFLADAAADEGHRLRLGHIDGGPTQILRSVIRSQPLVDPTGRLLVCEGGQLVAYPFDLDSGALGAESTLIETDVYPLGNQHELPVSVAAQGMVAFQHTTAESNLVFVDDAGRTIRTVGEPGRYGNLRISPDGTRLAFEVFSESAERLIWALDLNRGVRTPVSQRETMADSSAWSPDSQVVYFDSNVHGRWEAYRQAVTGGGNPERLGLPDTASEVVVLDVSSDGRWLLGAPTMGTNRYDLYLYSLDGGGTWTPWLSSAAQEGYGVFSPDGRWIAYTSDASGRSEVYLAPFEGGPSAGRWPISSGGGFEPRFSPDGSTLYYRSAAFDVMAVDLQLAAGSVQASTPRALFAIAPLELPYRRNLIDVLPDGSGFVTLQPATSDQLFIRIRSRR